MLLDALIGRFGYELKHKSEPLRGYTGFLEHCKGRGLEVKTVFDVGVGYGTEWLYDEFPQCELVLVEPLKQFVPTLVEIKQRYKARYYTAALGSSPGRMEINVAQDHLTASSLKLHSKDLLSAVKKTGTERTYVKQEVEIVRLDDLNVFESPYLIKLDVEGFELEALLGARETLKDTELVILEASLLDRYEDCESFLEICKFLDAMGFALYEVVQVGTRSRDGPVSYLDAAFVPKFSKLRAF